MTTPHAHSPTLLKPAKPVGIVGYGAYVPRFRLPAKEVSRVWTGGKGGLPIKEKWEALAQTVPQWDRLVNTPIGQPDHGA